MSDNPMNAIKENLGRIRQLYGEERYRFAAAHTLRMIMAQSPELKDELFAAVREVDPNIDPEELVKTSPPMPGGPANMQDMESAVVQALRTSMPGIQTQAQLNLVLASFEVLKASLNASFLGNKEQAAGFRAQLNQALDSADQITALSVKLSQVPEAASSKEADAFKNPPAQFTEQEKAQELKEQLVTIENISDLNAWYKANRAKIDQVVTPSHRNDLLDSIRARQKELNPA
jgi:hypothetical protein